MTTVKLESDVVKEMRILKAELGNKSYSSLINDLIKYYKDVNNGK